jgi:uncharacterized protein YoaH (UPF0181 family)
MTYLKLHRNLITLNEHFEPSPHRNSRPGAILIQIMLPYREVRPANAGQPAETPRLIIEHVRGKVAKKEHRGKLVKIACQTCQRRKVKCDGIRPMCTNCRSRQHTCHYEAPEELTGYQALRMDHSKLKQIMAQNLEVLELLRRRPMPEAIAILEHIREGISAGNILKLVAEADQLIEMSANKQCSHVPRQTRP